MTWDSAAIRCAASMADLAALRALLRDICSVCIADEAGVRITDPWGRALDAGHV